MPTALATQQQLVEQVHASGQRLVLALTGGGSGAISSLLSVPGASRSILAATVPYSQAALVEWLGGTPDEACSSRTARAMAMAGYLKAQKYAAASGGSEGGVAGVACTASLASDRPKRGSHRAHLAWQSAQTTATYHVEFKKGLRTRAEEETLLARLVLNVAAQACGLAVQTELSLSSGEAIEIERAEASADEQDLLSGQLAAIRRGSSPTGSGTPQVVFPGAFNPAHDAHRQMIEVARRRLGQEVACEISIENVDKPPLDFLEIQTRAQQFPTDAKLWFTRAPSFAKKAEIFPGATFVVGADTIERVGQGRYYGDNPAALSAAIAKIAAQGCRFLVFGRVVDGKFQSLEDLRLPVELAKLCQGVPELEFRSDLSSTELRRQALAGGE